MSLMLNSAMDANFYKNNYSFFVVTPNMTGACILGGWDYREDANDQLKEIKESGKQAKIVARRTLIQSGIDPNKKEFWSTGI